MLIIHIGEHVDFVNFITFYMQFKSKNLEHIGITNWLDISFLTKLSRFRPLDSFFGYFLG